jgi:hypothetical protein
MKLVLRYDIGDGTVEVSTNLYVIVQWERRYKRKASDMAAGVGVEDLAYMAWEASKLHGVVVPAEFDTFVKKIVEGVEVVEQIEAVPFETALTDTTSQDS